MGRPGGIIRPMWLPTLLVSALALPGALSVIGPPHAVINLDEAPRQRMVPAVTALLAARNFSASFAPVFAHHNASLFDRIGTDRMHDLLAWMDTHYPDSAEELRGIASAISAHPNGGYVSPVYLAAWTWFHELAHTSASLHSAAELRACTAYLATDETGDVVHGRNMDQEPREARYLAVSMDLRRGNATVLRAFDWYWFAGGFMTAVRRGVAGLQENWRFGTVATESVFKAAQAGVLPQLFLFRRLLSARTPPSWAALVHSLATTPLAAGLYVAASGPSGRGAVVVRNATAAEGVVALGADQHFYLVVTNSDPWRPDPDGRRTTAERSAASLGQAAATTDIGAYAVISTQPTRNSETCYSAILRPSTGALLPFIRSPND